jgi:Uma2 family endonuclease
VKGAPSCKHFGDEISKRERMAVRIPPRTDDLDLDLIRISAENPGYRVERYGDGTVVMSPTGGFGGAKSGEAFGQVRDYARRVGGKAFDSNQAWKFLDSLDRDADLSPDASWLSQEQVDAVPPEDRASSRFLRIVPDVAIDVRSPSDAWRDTRAKIDLYHANGVRYAVAIDPATRAVKELGTLPAGLVLDFDAIIDA